MSLKTYTYPHVSVTTKAIVHAAAVAEDSTATVMFAPFVSSKGPENKVVKVTSYSDFVALFGTLDYATQGQSVLQIGNWLTNGGAVDAYRITAGKAIGDYKSDLEYYSGKYYIAIDGRRTSVLLKDAGGNDIEIGIAFKSTPSKEIVYTISDDGVAVGGTGDVVANTSIVILNTAKDNEINDAELASLKTILGLSDTTLDSTTILKELSSYGNTTNNMGIDQVKISDGKYYFILEDQTEEKATGVSVGQNNAAAIKLTSSSTDDYIMAGNKKTDFKIVSDGVKAKGVFYDISTSALKSGASVEAKYSGTFYNGVRVRIVGTSDTAFSVYVYESGETYPSESYKGITKSTISKVVAASDYIGAITLTNGTDVSTSLAIEAILGKTYSGYADGVLGTDVAYSEDIMIRAIQTGLSSRIETPCDVFIDPGYSLESKYLLCDEFCGSQEGARNDVHLYLSEYAISDFSGASVPTAVSWSWPEYYDGTAYDFTNCSMYDHYLSVTDEYSLSEGKDVYVTGTYFLSGLVPYNDATYGIQYPTAGLTRGVIPASSVKAIDSVLTIAEKQSDYDSRINYIEKDSRRYAYMCQRTGVSENTALQYVNNSRVLKRMSREIEDIARGYLHEFNDAETLSNIQKVINRYIADWVANRTLKYGTAEVSSSADNELDISLSVKFTGTIELINVLIVVE
jgi:hypothetical protein